MTHILNGGNLVVKCLLRITGERGAGERRKENVRVLALLLKSQLGGSNKHFTEKQHGNDFANGIYKVTWKVFLDMFFDLNKSLQVDE